MKKVTYHEFRKPREFAYCRETIDEDMLQAFSIGRGWRGIVHDLIGDLFDAGWDGNLLQVKEKLGGLRFYISQADDEFQRLIREAERSSYVTCEVCHAPTKKGELRRGNWLKTLCDNHIAEKKL